MPLVTTEQLFELEPVPGGTRLVHGQEAWGPLVAADGTGRRERMRDRALRDYAPFEAALRDRVATSMRP